MNDKGKRGYNTNHHSAIGMSPFEALYGYSPTPLTFLPTAKTSIATVYGFFYKRQYCQLLKENLQAAQLRMKQQADKQRSERAFEVGDWVFLKLQSAALQTYLLRMRKSLKLSARYYGPFQVFAKIGQDTYKLQLPPNCIIHPVFHVSLLKKKIGDNITLMPNLPTMSANNCVVAPESILQTRTILRN